MMNFKKEIPIFFAVDDFYAPYLAVAIQSIKENSSRENKYSIYVLITNISERNAVRLSAMQTENISIEFVNVREKMQKMKESLQLRDYYTATTYYRFFIPELFPQYKKGLYIDCDVVVTTDIDELYSTDLGEKMVGAAVEDFVVATAEFREWTKTALNISADEYFNAGVLVMNLEKMRDENILGRFMSLNKIKKYPVAQDQDYLNVICKGDVYYLNERWNRSPHFTTPCDTPKLAHYKLTYKPWHYYGVKFENCFWKYAASTEYYRELLEERANYPKEKIEKDETQTRGLSELAIRETEIALGAVAALA